MTWPEYQAAAALGKTKGTGQPGLGECGQLLGRRWERTGGGESSSEGAEVWGSSCLFSLGSYFLFVTVQVIG
jgi:hypothetical protein